MELLFLFEGVVEGWSELKEWLDLSHEMTWTSLILALMVKKKL